MLTQQTITNELAFDPPDPDGATGPLGDPPPVTARITSENPVGANGWYMDLLTPGTPNPSYQNEKQVTKPIVRNGHVIFTTVIPETNPCSGGGRSWIMELSVLSGARLDEPPFDINNDGKFDNADLIPVTDANGDTIYVSAERTGVRGWHGHPAVAGRRRRRCPPGRCSTSTRRAPRAAFSASPRIPAPARPAVNRGDKYVEGD